MRGAETDPPREYMDDGLFQNVITNKEKKAKRHIFLFSDIVIFTQPKGKDKKSKKDPSSPGDDKIYLYLFDIPLESCILWDLHDDDGGIYSFIFP